MSDSPPLALPFHCLDVVLHPYAQPALHTHENHELFFAMAGTGEQVTDQRAFSMKPGELFLFPHGMPHICRPATKVRGLVLNVQDQALAPATVGDRESARILSRLCERARNYECRIVLTSEGSRRVRRLFSDMVAEYLNKKVGYRAAVKVRFQQILLAVLRDASAGLDLQRGFAPARVQERLSDVLRHLHAGYREPVSVAAMARLAHLSRSHFHAVFKQETGRTLTQYVNALRIDAATKLLCDTELSIMEVAEQVGFSCMSHFYAVFGALAGSSPKAVRSLRARAP